MDAAAAVKVELRAWWRGLSSAPAKLTKEQHVVVWMVGVAIALTRTLAVARSMWDWDEALFGLALRDYDVSAHHPHPPGFPLFIATAKLVLVVARTSEFHALQVVAVVASLLVFPAMCFLAREVRAPFFVAVASAAMLALMPNVWFFGGTALSDVPSMVLSLAACGLLWCGVRSNRSAFIGMVIAAVAAGYRPQNLLICFVPAAIALVKRPRAAIAGVVVAAAIIVASYGFAASLSGGWLQYREAVETHQQYIRTTDSFVSPHRPPLWRVADDFFFRPFRLPFANVAITLLAMAGLARRRPSSLAVVAMFGPFLLFAWLMLDFHSSSRFSIAYMPMYAYLAAEGAALLPRWRVAVVTGLLTAITLWMLAPLRVVRETLSPPVAAAEWITKTHPGSAVVVDPRVRPLAEYLLPHHDLRETREGAPAGTILLREFGSHAPGAKNFVRTRARLSRALTRPRYFEISVVPLGER